MPAHDQRHAVRVTSLLLDEGHSDHDLIVAALLHDLAKGGTPDCPGQVRLTDRVLRVLLGRVAPDALLRLASDPDRPLRRGLHLAVYHAQLGAIAAAAAGSSDRTCWLIAHHDDPAGDDPGLAALMEADAAAH